MTNYSQNWSIRIIKAFPHLCKSLQILAWLIMLASSYLASKETEPVIETEAEGKGV